MTTRAAADEIRIFPPAPGQSMQWDAIGDSVMGGVSSGSARRDAEGNLVFEGTVSLERNGGFASVRSARAAIGARRAVAVRLQVRSDGKRYKLNLKTDAAFDGLQYQATFTTPAGEWTSVMLPFDAFAPKFRGRDVPDAPALDPARIVTVGFLISDRQEGPFRLEVRAISFMAKDGAP